jgi:hypothetical protein
MRNRFAIILAAALSIFLIDSTGLSEETKLGVRKWTASWIACPDAPVRDAGVFHFRKLLTLESVPTHFIVHVSADNQFLLYVNQQRVGTGPARGDLAHWRFETYDLAPLLHVGTNVVGATVWSFGEHSAIAQMGDRAGFLLQGKTTSEQAADTNDSGKRNKRRESR